MKITYNSPVILTYVFAAVIIFAVDKLALGMWMTDHIFTTYPIFHLSHILDYIRLPAHALGHSSWSHLIGNATFLLLLGPMVEEKYGSVGLFEMILIAATATGILNTLFFAQGLRGASGIVFLLILLSSITNIKSREIPLTFVLIAVLFLGQEIVGAFHKDNISQFAHILGGVVGSLFGFILVRDRV